MNEGAAPKEHEPDAGATHEPDAVPVLCLVLTTWPADRPADALADALVAERLAACVNVLPPMRSYYRWQGDIERAEEHQVLIKTTRTRVPALQARLAALHPYDVPELVVLDAEAGEAYGVWVRASVAREG